MHPGSRIRIVRKHHRWTQENLAERLGVHPLTVTRWEADPSKSNALTPDRVTLLAIAHISDASSRWLIDGVGEPFPELNWNPTTVANRPILESSAFDSGAIWPEVADSANHYPIQCGLADALCGQAGGGHEDDLFWMRVLGDGMTPTLRENELVLLHVGLQGRRHPRNHGIYLVRRSPDSVEARVKRLRVDLAPGQLTLTSDNPAFQPITIDPDGIPLQQLLLGRVVLLQRHLVDLDPQESDW